MPGVFTCWQGQKNKREQNDRRPKKLPDKLYCKVLVKYKPKVFVFENVPDF